MAVIDFTNLTVSSTVSKISSTHELSSDITVSLENAVQTTAAAMQVIEQGPLRKYRGPIDALYSQFAQYWKSGEGQERWTKKSLAKTVQQRVYDISQRSGTSKPPTTTKSASKKRKDSVLNDASGQPSHKDTLVQSKESDSPVKVESPIPHADSLVDDPRPPSKKKPRIHSSRHSRVSDGSHLYKEESAEWRPESPSTTLSLSNSQARRSIASRSPISNDNVTDAVRTIHPSEVVIVFVPTKPPSFGPPFKSLLLWRCQRPEDDGRDASKEALRDYRDLSFADFIRRLHELQVLADGELVVWGEFAQVVDSDLTFSGAVEEQVEASREQGRPSKEVTFEAAVRPK